MICIPSKEIQPKPDNRPSEKCRILHVKIYYFITINIRKYAAMLIGCMRMASAYLLDWFLQPPTLPYLLNY